MNITKSDIALGTLAVATFAQTITASIAVSGAFDPAVTAIIAAFSAGFTALGLFVSSRMKS